MNCGRLIVTIFAILFSVSAYAANPFLDAANDQSISAKFRGTEWSEDIGDKEIHLTAQVKTTRLAKMPWGAIFKIEYTDLKSRAEKQREIRPDYFIVTDDRIVPLNEEDNDAVVKKISAPTSRRISNQTTFTASPAATSNTRRESGKRQSN